MCCLLFTEARVGICSFPSSYRYDWFYQRRSSYNIIKRFETYVISTIKKQIDSIADGSVEGIHINDEVVAVSFHFCSEMQSDVK